MAESVIARMKWIDWLVLIVAFIYILWPLDFLPANFIDDFMVLIISIVFVYVRIGMQTKYSV